MASILIIEDNKEVRDNLYDILSLAGYQPRAAENGKQGLEMAFAASPDLILCDVMMRDLDGFGVLQILQSREETQHIPVVFVTAKSELEDMRRGMNLGADDYITKPFYKDELLRVLEVRLRKNKIRQKAQGIGSLPETASPKRGDLQASLDDLLTHSSRRHYRRGEALFREGEQVRDIFVLRSGYVKLQSSTDFGKTLIVFVFQPNQIFGYPEFMVDRLYEHDAVALTNAQADLIPVDILREKLRSDQVLSDFFMGLLANGLLDSDVRMKEQAYLSVRKRCADTLLLAAEIFGDQPWPMSREELAQWAGTAKETFIRNMTEFRDSGWIEIDHQEVHILEASKLSLVPG